MPVANDQIRQILTSRQRPKRRVRHPASSKPTSRFEKLFQDELWVNREGEIVYLDEDIDPRYAQNLVSFLERRADLYHGYLRESRPSDPGCGLDPVQWIRATPLVCALLDIAAELD